MEKSVPDKVNRSAAAIRTRRMSVRCPVCHYRLMDVRIRETEKSEPFLLSRQSFAPIEVKCPKCRHMIGVRKANNTK